MVSVQKSYPLESWAGGPRPPFYKARKTFGGTIPWIGMHAVDLIRWFSGSEFASVAAAQTTVGNQDHGELESAATLHFRLASGALGTAQVDFLRRRVEPKAKDSWGDDRLRALGDGGMLEIRGGLAWAVDARGARHEIAPETAPPLFAAFAEWTRGGAPLLLSTEDCLRAAEATLHARDAADRGAVIAL
jgi:predicted dehydrogenase